MAKGRRSRRVKLEHRTPEEVGGAPARPQDSAPRPDGANDEMISRIDALRNDVKAAKSQAATRTRGPGPITASLPPPPPPKRETNQAPVPAEADRTEALTPPADEPTQANEVIGDTEPTTLIEPAPAAPTAENGRKEEKVSDAPGALAATAVTGTVAAGLAEADKPAENPTEAPTGTAAAAKDEPASPATPTPNKSGYSAKKAPQPGASPASAKTGKTAAAAGAGRAASAGTAKKAGTRPGGAKGTPPPTKPVRTGPIGNRPELHPPYSRPVSHRRRNLIIGLAAVAVAVGVVVALLATGGSSKPKPTPIAAYLTAHVPSGTAIISVQAPNGQVPTAYPTLPVTAAELPGQTSAKYIIGPDPVSVAGQPAASWIESHAALVATSSGHATLWRVAAVTPGATATSVPATTATTAPATTASTVPTTAAPATTLAPAPPVTAAPTTTPTTAAPSTTPTTAAPSTVPSSTVPSSGTPPPSATPGTPSAPATTYAVQKGQSFWAIAQAVVTQRLGTTPTAAQIGHYWAELVAANTGHLPVPGNPNLIYSGTTLVLPAGG